MGYEPLDERDVYRPPTYDEVRDHLRQVYPEVPDDQLRQSFERRRNMMIARDRYADWEPPPVHYAIQTMPFAGTFHNMRIDVQHARAQARVDAGNPEAGDYDTLAEVERARDIEARRSTGLELFLQGLRVPAMYGEAVLGGQALGAAAQLPRLGYPLRAIGLGAGEAAPLLSARGAAQAVGRNALQTAVMPSMYGEDAVRRNTEAGRDPLDLRGLPPAFGVGMINTAILGSMGSQAGFLSSGTSFGSTLKRIGYAGPVGLAESEFAHALTYATGLETSYGPVVEMLKGKDNAWKQVASSFMAFAVFGAMHAPPRDRSKVIKETMEKLADKAEELKQQGVSPEEAAQILQREAMVEHLDAFGPRPPGEEPAQPGVGAEPSQPQATETGQPRPITPVDEPTRRPAWMVPPSERPQEAPAVAPEPPKPPGEQNATEAAPNAQAAQNQAIPGRSVAPVAERRTPADVFRDYLDNKATKEQVNESARLTEGQAKVFWQRFEAMREGNPVTQVDIARDLGVKRQAVNQQEVNAIRKLGLPGRSIEEMMTALAGTERSAFGQSRMPEIPGADADIPSDAAKIRMQAQQQAPVGDLHQMPRNIEDRLAPIHDKWQAILEKRPLTADEKQQYIREVLGKGLHESEGGHDETEAFTDEVLDAAERAIGKGKPGAPAVAKAAGITVQEAQRIMPDIAREINVRRAAKKSAGARPSNSAPIPEPEASARLDAPDNAAQEKSAQPVGVIGAPENTGARTAESVPPRSDSDQGNPLGSPLRKPGELGPRKFATGVPPSAERRTEAPDPEFHAAKHASVDEDRIARGLEPIVKKLRKAWGPLQELAEHELFRNPNIGIEKVDNYTERPRALENEVDQAIVLNHRIRVQNEYDKVIKAINKNLDPSNPAMPENRIRAAMLEDQLTKADTVLNHGGSTTGAVLNARKMMIAEDFSVSRMVMQEQAARGRKLNEVEANEVAKKSEKIEDKQKEVDAEDREARSRTTAGQKANLDIGNLAQKLAKKLVETGVHDREKLIDAVHHKLTEIDPDITRRETMDAISGYGKYTLLSKEEAAVKLRQLKGEMQQLGKLEDMEAGQAPLKTGMERREPSADERRLIKEVNEAKKRGGFDVTDPEKQLKTSLDAVKTRLNNQIEDLEHSLSTREELVKKKSGLNYDAEANKLRSRRDVLKEQYEAIFGKKETTDEQRLKIAISAVEKSILEIDRQIKTGEFGPQPKESKVPKDQWLDALKARRDALKTERDGLRAAADQNMQKPKEMTDEQRLKIATSAVEKSILEIDRQIKTGEFGPQPKESKVPKDQWLDALKARRDALKTERDGLRAAADQNMQKPPEFVRNQAYKTATMRKMAELQERMARGDFEKAAKNEPAPLSGGNLKLKAELEHLKDQWREGNLRLQASQRSMVEKTLGLATKWRRGFILNSPVTIAKLTSAAVQRVVFTPIEQLAAHGLGLAFPKFAEKAIYEKGSSLAIEVKAIQEGLSRMGEDIKSIMKTGQMDIGHVYGKKAYDIDPSVADVPGKIHAALKTVPKRTAFTRAELMGLEGAAKAGLDVTDPLVQDRIGVEAYKIAEKSIFQQDSWVTQRWERAMTPIIDPATGKETSGSIATRFAGKMLLPIIKVPTNIVLETFNHVFGGVVGGARLANAYAKGIESLHPAQADSIMSQLKKGSVGMAVLALGYYLRNDIGGYYQPGEKRDPNDVSAGAIRIGGVEIPPYLLHHPLMSALQIGASIGRFAEHKVKGEEAGYGVATARALLGMVEEVPFVRETADIHKLTEDRTMTGAIGQQAQSYIVPAGISWAARQTDRDESGALIHRQQPSVLSHIQAAVPGLRQQLKDDTATHDLGLRLRAVEEQRLNHNHSASSAGTPFPREREYHFLAASSRRIADLEHMLQGEVRVGAGGYRPVGAKAEGERADRIRMEQIRVARQALDRTR